MEKQKEDHVCLLIQMQKKNVSDLLKTVFIHIRAKTNWGESDIVFRFHQNCIDQNSLKAQVGKLRRSVAVSTLFCDQTRAREKEKRCYEEEKKIS